jgi:electron transport complex protein RnfE
LLLGKSFDFLEITVIPNYKGFLLMALPPGGFIMLAFLIVGKRLIDRKLAAGKNPLQQTVTDNVNGCGGCHARVACSHP